MATINKVFAYSDIDLKDFTTGPVGYKVIGSAANAKLGLENELVGDFNGDGLDDMILGASGSHQVYVFFGRTGNVESVVDMANFESSESTGIIVLGEIAGDYFGEFFGKAGDVNGDGYDDIVIGAWYAASGALVRVGKAYVIFGRPNSQVSTDL